MEMLPSTDTLVSSFSTLTLEPWVEPDIMPMPEGLSELTFAGMLGGRRFRYFRRNGHVLSADADFVDAGQFTLDPGLN